jgi:osmotically-inducible protein OsmY
MNVRVIGWLAILACSPAWAYQGPPANQAQPPSQTQPPSQPASQIHSSADAQLQASVRKAIANDKSLSDAGHHVNVIVSDGAVVLRGPVKDDTEKSRIDTLVRQVGGVKELTNELDVKPGQL